MPTRRVAVVALVAALAAPRVARLLYPQVWIEDDSYLHNAFLLARGFHPYRDFPLPHFPLLEALLAAVFLVAPIAIRTAEIVTQIAALGASLLVFALGRRLHGGVAGTAAALVFATSALLFRYHVFEREVFLLPPVLGAVLLSTAGGRGPEGTRPAVAAGALFAAALAIKLTALAALAATIIWLWLDGRRRPAAIVAATAGAILAAAAAALAVRFGTDFLVQVFVFRIVHAVFPSFAVKLDEMRYSMDISFAFGLAGVALIVLRGEAWRWRGVLLQLACGLVVLVLLNPTFWAHTGIELLPWLSLAAGRLIAAAVELVSVRRERASTIACLAAAAALVVYVAPIRNVNWEPGDRTAYGFGYRDRAELEAMGAFVRAHSAEDALVAVPPILAFVANRAEVVPYAEIAGTVDELTDSIRARGYLATIGGAARRDESFWDSVEASRDRMAPRLDAALAAHRVAVLINDSPDDLVAVPLVHVSPEQLERDRYALEWVSGHYEAWVPR